MQTMRFCFYSQIQPFYHLFAINYHTKTYLLQPDTFINLKSYDVCSALSMHITSTEDGVYFVEHTVASSHHGVKTRLVTCEEKPNQKCISSTASTQRIKSNPKSCLLRDRERRRRCDDPYGKFRATHHLTIARQGVGGQKGKILL